MTRVLLACALLTACPAAPLATERIADCCAPGDAGEPCEWTTTRYDVPRWATPLASDAHACRDVGLEPYEP